MQLHLPCLKGVIERYIRLLLLVLICLCLFQAQYRSKEGGLETQLQEFRDTKTKLQHTVQMKSDMTVSLEIKRANWNQ